MNDFVGYDSPYAKFLEKDLARIEKILQRLMLDYWERKPIDSIIAEIEEWMGDDWYIELSREDEKRLCAIKGWSYE